MQLQEENGVLSEEKFVNMVADVYGSQHVILYAPDGSSLIDSDGHITTKMERLASVVAFNIANAQSLSDQIRIGGASMGMIMMPPAWTAARCSVYLN